MNLFALLLEWKAFVFLLLLSALLGFIPNEFARTVSVIILAVVLVGGGYKLMKAGLKEKNEVWRQAAETLGLAFFPGSFASFPSMSGRIDGREAKASITGGRKGGKMQGETRFTVEVELHKPTNIDTEIRIEKNSFYRDAVYKPSNVRLKEFSPKIKGKDFYGETNDAEKTKKLIMQIEEGLTRIFEEKDAAFFAVSSNKIFAGKKRGSGPEANEVDDPFLREIVSMAEKIDAHIQL